MQGVWLRTGGTSRQPLPDPMRISQLHSQPCSHLGAGRALCKGPALSSEGTKPGRCGRLVSPWCAWHSEPLPLRMSGCVSACWCLPWHQPMSCHRLGAVLCRSPCSSVAGFLWLSRTCAQPAGCSVEWRAPTCSVLPRQHPTCRLSPSLPCRG